jgi:DNA primase large subunit
MITSNFFVDFRVIRDKKHMDRMVNSLDINYIKSVREAFDYLNGLIRKYANNEGYNITMGKNAFAIALWMLRYINEPGMTSRFVITQRDVFESELYRISKESNENIIFYCDSAGIDATLDGNSFRIPFDFFINNNKKISGYKYRLVYQKIKDGFISTGKEEFAHLLREDFVVKIMDAYNSIMAGDSQDVFRKYTMDLDKIKKEYLEIKAKNVVSFGDIDFSMFPPCINEYINEIRDGGNPSHLARLTLATFLHHIGMENDDITKIFRGTADFDESSATYQIDHLTGKISGIEYNPPKCATLKSNNLCYMGDDKLCKIIKHPLQYYEYKKRVNKKLK